MSYTYGDLLNDLQKLPPEILRQPAQVLPPFSDHDAVIPLLPVVCCETLDELGVAATRGSLDNLHHADAIVLMADQNFYAKDGHVAEDLITGEKIFPETRPDWPT